MVINLQGTVKLIEFFSNHGCSVLEVILFHNLSSYSAHIMRRVERFSTQCIVEMGSHATPSVTHGWSY